MTRHHQLKNEARRAEQRSDWARAIELYKSAIRFEEERESGSDVGVYNRVGDLYLRQGNTAAAVEYYEQAADRYAANGLHTSAIALCNKILRIAPDRDEVYGRLARLHASTGLLAEARSAFLRFADRMRETDRLSDALEAVQDLVSLTGDEELRTAFAEQLVGAGLGAQAVAQLRLVYQARVAGGRNAQDIREKIISLDPDADPVGSTELPPPRATPTPDPVISDGPLPGLDVSGPSAPTEAAEVLPDEPAPGFDEVSFDLPETSAESDLSVESVLTRFRSQVRDIVEETDHAVHYDLGVAYMGMDLLDDAIGEFRLAMQSPALMESAHALLGECIRARGASEHPETAELDLPAGDGPLLPLAAPDDFMMGQSLDLGVAAETSEPESAVEPSEPELAAETSEPEWAVDPPIEQEPEGEPEAASSAAEDELADMLFQARLAQHRTRAATEDGRTDHEAHLSLGQTYERMGLITEAVSDLVTALEGPPAVKDEALAVLERVVSSPAIDASALAEGLASLMEHGRAEVAIATGREFVGRPGIREVDRQTVLALLPEDEPDPIAETQSEARTDPAKEALAELGDILAELDDIAGDELDLGALEIPLEGSLVEPATDSHESGAASGAATPGETGMSLFGEAEGLRAAGRMDEAESHYYRALELFEKKRDAINAIRAVDRLLGLRPDDVVLHHQKNEFAIMTNDRELLVSSYLDLAACLRRQNGFRIARTVYGRILDLDPQNAEARAGIAAVDADELARERRRQEQADQRASAAPAAEAVEQTRVEVVKSPGEIDAMFEDLNVEDGDAKEAPPDFESHFELGVAFKQMEMWDEAAREFKQALQGIGNPLLAYENLGECLLALRRYDEARRTLGFAATQPGPDQDKAGVLFQLGVAHLRSGDTPSARTCLERVVEIDPSRADATRLLSTLPA
jgi:tetratricopeptide (TPR) repeat protein